MRKYKRVNINPDLNFGRGAFSGWREHRYGAKKPVAPGRIFNPDKHRHVVALAVEQLADWRGSPFQHEGTCRAGLRSALCIEGHSWMAADLEAAIVVEDALRIIGAERPTWAEAQDHHTVSSDYCSWCRKLIDEEDVMSGHRFCSVVCANAALTHRTYATSASDDAVGKAAYNLIAKGKAQTKECEFCLKTFRSRFKDARYCSVKCASRHQKGEALLYEIACAWCGDMFQPGNKWQLYCCHSCHGFSRHAEEKQRMSGERRKCSCCGTEFVPTTEKGIYCSRRCSSTAASRRQYARNRASHSCACLWCGGEFASKMPWAKYCCKEHKRFDDARLRKEKANNLIYLTPYSFDGLFKVAA